MRLHLVLSSMLACGIAACASHTSSAADSASATSSEAAAASPANGACPFIANAQVGQVLHLTVTGVDVTSDDTGTSCDFHAKETAAAITVKYSSQGGPKEMSSESETAKTMNGAFGSASSLPTPPTDVPKVGDDQTFVIEKSVKGFIATKGDSYAEVTGTFLPDKITIWYSFPELARQVLASH